MQRSMDVIDLMNDYSIGQKLYLYAQEEISAQIEGENFTPSYDVYHGIHSKPSYMLGKTVSKEDSFYNSFRQGLKEHQIFATVDQLKKTCTSFASNPPDWFKNGIKQNINSDNPRRKTWKEFGKNLQVENRWGDPDIQGWILCSKFDVKLYLIEKQIGYEKYTTKIIDKDSCTMLYCELFFSNEKELTIVNYGSGRYEPLLNSLAQIMIGKFGDFKIRNNKVIRTKTAETIMNADSELKDDQNNDTHNLIINVLNSLEKIVKKGDIHMFKEKIDFLSNIDRKLLMEIYENPRNSLKDSNIIILPCKYDKLHILRYIIHGSNIIYHFPPIDLKRAYDCKEDAISYAFKTANIDLLETLYDHFLDDLHWSCNHQSQDIIEQLKELNAILIKTWTNYGVILNQNLQQIVDVHCLIEISNFQIDLYTKLAEINYNFSNIDNIRTVETETVVKIMLTILGIYQKYRSKDIRLPSDVPGVEVRIQKLFEDKTSIYMKNIHQCMYELYYRKLDSNASLLILDNLHYMQQRLQLASDDYKELESAIYYFINRVYEDWRLFLPKHREKTKVEYLVDTYDSKRKYRVSAIYDQSKMFLGPVLYLSRKDFCDALKKFEGILENTVVKDKIRPKGKKLPVVELNRLTLLPLMRDNFSLKKILVYLESLCKVNLDTDMDAGILMIERAIQVIGELFKTTNESVHLDSLTKALLEFEIPSEVIENLKSMRNFLSHSDKARLLRRIYVATKEPNHYKEALKDLNEIKERIYEVINLYDPVIDKWIVDKGLNIIRTRKNELHVVHLPILRMQLTIMPPIEFPDSFIKYEKKLMEEHKISRQLLREINSLNNNEDELSNIHHCIKIYLLRLVCKKLDNFSDAILNKLQYIHNNDSEECLKEWEFIIKLFEYIVTVAGFLDEHPFEIKHSSYSRMIESIQKRDSHRRGTFEANMLLNTIKLYAQEYDLEDDSSPVDSIAIINRDHDFKGLRSLKSTLDNHFRFIINEELRYVLDDFTKSYGDAANKVYKDYEKIFKKVIENEPIPGAERKKLCSLNLDNESKKIIRCLDMGTNRGSKLRYCFENRIDILKRLLDGPNENVKSVVLKYKHDESFRLAFEMVLIDIMNVLKHIKETDALTKQKNMYTEANIRNILEHSEPLLEVIGTALDPNDFATELAEKALEFIRKANDWMTALETLKK